MAAVLGALRERFHEARAELFVRLLAPRAGARVLDLGGSDGELSARIARRVPVAVTVADVEATHREAVQARGFRHVRLEGAGALPFEDGEFDVVLCNSVIEHVTLPKERCTARGGVQQAEWRRESARAQAAFAAEVRRVGRGYFVQTPHKHFPVDPHIVLPLTQYLSHEAACRLVSVTDRFWIKSCWGLVDWELLTPRDMRRLFPDGALHVERFGGLPKSIVAYRRGAAA